MFLSKVDVEDNCETDANKEIRTSGPNLTLLKEDLEYSSSEDEDSGSDDNVNEDSDSDDTSSSEEDDEHVGNNESGNYHNNNEEGPSITISSDSEEATSAAPTPLQKTRPSKMEI